MIFFQSSCQGETHPVCEELYQLSTDPDGCFNYPKIFFNDVSLKCLDICKNDVTSCLPGCLYHELGIMEDGNQFNIDKLIESYSESNMTKNISEKWTKLVTQAVKKCGTKCANFEFK